MLPALLPANQESRSEGLKFYELSFASFPKHAQVYFSFDGPKQDALHINLNTCGGMIGDEIRVDVINKNLWLGVDEEQLLLQAGRYMIDLRRITCCFH